MTRFASPSIISSIIAILLTAVFATPTGAQTASMRLEGIVWDPTGEPLSGVTLTAVEEDTGRQAETVSDSEGYYRFLVLQPGIYSVTAKAKGFKDVIHRNIMLFSPESTLDNFSFEVSAIEKEVSPDEFPKLNDSATSDAFSRHEIGALPLMYRNPLSLLIYQPGVQINSGNEDESTINGARKAMNRIVLDGLSISDPILPSLGASLLTTNPDSITAIQMVSLGAKAEYGGSGGGQFVLASRPGSKSWSAEAYDYFRSRTLNANEFFANTLHYPRPGLAGNIFGVTASGPVGNKTRIFANYEGNRTDQQLINTRVVLTESAKSGVFKWYTPDDATRNSTTVRSFDIVANDPRGLGIDPAIASTIARLPEPNTNQVGDGLNTGGYRFDNPMTIKQDRLAARIDRNLNANHQLFFRLNLERSDSTDIFHYAEASFPGELSGAYQKNSWAFAFGSDWTLSPRMVNELRIGYIQPKVELKRPARQSTPMFLANSWTNPLDPSFPRSDKFPAIEIADNLSHMRGRHALKYGISFRRTLQKSIDYYGVYPNVTFASDNGNAPDSSIGPQEQYEISETDRDIFENLYNDLLGRMESVTQSFNSTLTSTLPVGTAKNRDFASNEFSAFIQDDWKILRNLTLNLGLRYEFRTSPKEQNGLQAVLDKASGINSSAEISDFSISARDRWYSTDRGNFAPRFGFAWDITGTGGTVVRGSYGIYFDLLNGAITKFVDVNGPGLSQTVQLYPNSSGSDLRLSDGIPLPTQSAPNLNPSATRSSSVAVLDPKLRTPRVDQFNLTLEKRALGLLLEIGYSGTRATNLFQYTNINQTKTRGDFLQAFQELKDYRDNGTPVSESNTLAKIFGSPMDAMYYMRGENFDSGEAGAAADEMDLNYYGNYAAAGVSDFYIRNFTQFDKLFYGSNTAKSWYDSVHMGIRKNTNYVHFRMYYTLSKALDTMSSDGATYVAPSDSFQPDINKAPSNFDRRHVLNAAWDYAIPFGRNRNSDSEMPKWLTGLFGGWNFGSLLVWESGPRFSVNSGRQNLFADVYSLANLDEENGSRSMGRIYKYAGNIYWFNPDQATFFSYPEAGEVGSSGRNSFTGPNYFGMDAVLYKKFYLSENRYVQFRLEAFNIFNNTHFGLPNTNLGDYNFGIITSTIGTPRSLQVGIRIRF